MKGIGKLRKMLDELNPSLFAMILFELAFMLVAELIIIIFLPSEWKLSCAIGMFFGVVYAVFASVHLSTCIRKVVYGRSNPRSTLVIGYSVRFLVMLLVFAALYFLNIGNLIAALIGMFSMKLAAYLEPFTNKLISGDKENNSEVKI